MAEPMAFEAWIEEGIRRFGEDRRDWRFVCPACGFVQSYWNFHDAGLHHDQIDRKLAYSCVGRVVGHHDTPMGTKPGPCNYSGGGLFRLNPVAVLDDQGQVHHLFAFAA